MEAMGTVSSKGQIVIPAELRRELGFKAGVRVRFKKQGTALLIERNSYEAVRALRGKYATLPLAHHLGESRLQDEKRLERLYEDLRS